MPCQGVHGGSLVARAILPLPCAPDGRASEASQVERETDQMGERGVIYIVWGDEIEPALERSRRSLAALHPELPVEVVRLEVDDPVKGLLEKARMFRRTPFRETLFLDADTVVLGRLDYAFDKARRFGLACSICENPWARRYAGLEGDLIEYNTGVLFFTVQARPVFEAWERLAAELDSSADFIDMRDNELHTMSHNDQCGFAAAVEECAMSPFVLPLNWNYRPEAQRHFFGPIKIWHDYHEPPDWLIEMNKYYESSASIVQFHSIVQYPSP